MLHQNPYTQSSSGKFSKDYPVLWWILISNVILFVLQTLVERLYGNATIFSHLALYSDFASELKPWTLVSYAFLHGSMPHILFNMLVVFFSGKMLESLMGSKRFAILYFSSVIAGSIAWLLTDAYGPLIGASAGALGLLVYTCYAIGPEKPVTFLLFFVIPVKMRPKWIIWYLIITNALGLASEIFKFSNPDPTMLFIGDSSSIAYSAHMGGIIAAFILYRMHSKGSPTSSGGIFVEPPKWFKKKKNIISAAKQKFQVKMSTNRQDLEKEVDRILDKINKDGFGALTIQERDTLDKAKDYLKR